MQFVDLRSSGQDSVCFSGSQRKEDVSVREELSQAEVAVKTVVGYEPLLVVSCQPFLKEDYHVQEVDFQKIHDIHGAYGFSFHPTVFFAC